MRIHEAINQVMNLCGAVAKTSTNPQQGYKYRGIDAVMNAINPALRQAKIFVVPEVLDVTREERTNSKGTTLIWSTVKVKYTFMAEDGSSVVAVVMGEGMDSGDKSMNKAMSAAYKYALFQTFCIPTDEMVDSEIDTPQVQPRQEKRLERGMSKISDVVLGNIQTLAQQRGVTLAQIIDRYKVSDIRELSEEQGRACINSLMNTK